MYPSCQHYRFFKRSFRIFAGKFYSFTVYMVCANSVVNPFVYAIQYHEFQQRIKEMICSKKQLLPELDSTSHIITIAIVDSGSN